VDFEEYVKMLCKQVSLSIADLVWGTWREFDCRDF
jgi:hypothetical protein